ncbi:hypothetical protein F5Y09DRAFT_137655 [Xylaria sp. FL1042]|nr:hypothetical protein F5Y09DRAFT_137655 [Xylaria sp. FL1042]
MAPALRMTRLIKEMQPIFFFFSLFFLFPSPFILFPLCIRSVVATPVVSGLAKGECHARGVIRYIKAVERCALNGVVFSATGSGRDPAFSRSDHRKSFI